jgi:hypothetical protein
MDLIDDSELPPEVEARIFELAAIATDLRIEAGELPGPAELLGIVDAVALLQTTGELPVPSAPVACDGCACRCAAATPLKRPTRRTDLTARRCRRRP